MSVSAGRQSQMVQSNVFMSRVFITFYLTCTEQTVFPLPVCKFQQRIQSSSMEILVAVSLIQLPCLVIGTHNTCMCVRCADTRQLIVCLQLISGRDWSGNETGPGMESTQPESHSHCCACNRSTQVFCSCRLCF